MIGPVKDRMREHLEDLRPVLAGLHGHQFGHTLYARHLISMRRQGREPVPPPQFARVLLAYGALRRAKWHHGEGRRMSGWLI